MDKSLPISIRSTQIDAERRILLWSAWALVLLLTLPEIVLRGFMQVDTAWMMAARPDLIVVMIMLTFIWSAIRPLRGLALIFLVIYGVEGWLLGSLVQQSVFFNSLSGDNTNLNFLGERLLRLGAVVVMIAVLLMMGFQRRDFFLAVGNLNAVAEPERWGVPRKPETWPGFGGRYALIIIVLLLLFMVPGLQPPVSLSNLSAELVLFAALCALINAFAEEFLYRAALLPQILPLFGKGKSLFLVAAWFGLAHYFGIPRGITGVIITAIGGWVFAKAMFETRGLGWPLFLHFVSDFTIYLVILLAGGF